MKKIWLLGAVFLLVSCGSNQTKLASEKKEQTKPNLCDEKVWKGLVPKGNFTVVYKGEFEGACRVVLFYPENGGKWYPLTIYSGTDNKPHALYGVNLVKGKLYEPPEERQAIAKFKLEYWNKLIARSIKSLKDFETVAVIGNGTQTAYFLLFKDEWNRFKKDVEKQLQLASEYLGMKIKVLVPNELKPFEFKLPFHQVFIIHGDRIEKTKFYIDFTELFKRSMEMRNGTGKSIGK